MATTIKRIGFGQVEPNHLSAQRTSQIYAQLPAKSDISILENGQYVKYDYANGEVNFTGKGEWMMVFNEVKLYDDKWRESYKDFAMIKDNYTAGSDDITHDGLGPFKGQMVPRVIKTNVGDIYTTNAVGAANTSGKAEYVGIALEVGDFLKVDTTGFLVKDETAEASTESMLWQVVKIYTMADGQPAVKVMRVK
ncbi:hypothetical protein [Megamonas funiformis]|uniref:hypothetical protein n=1 Tax=Megamonas funiformis TaxID=437897 RepID=UPI003F83B2DD